MFIAHPKDLTALVHFNAYLARTNSVVKIAFTMCIVIVQITDNTALARQRLEDAALRAAAVARRGTAGAKPCSQYQE